MFESRVLRKIFGPKRDKLKGGEWKRLHNEELYDLCFLTKYYLVDQIKKNEMGRSCGTYGKQGNCIHHFGGEI